MLLRRSRVLCVVASSLGALAPLACSDEPPPVGNVGGGGAENGSGGAGGLGGPGGSPTSPTPSGPLQLAFERIPLPTSDQGGTDFRFVPGADDEIVMLTRQGTVVHARVQGNVAQNLHHWSIPDTLHLRHACVPTNVLFDPEFETNGFVYISYCTGPQITRLTRFQLSLTSGLSNPQVIVETFRDGGDAWHRFGSMGFEEDGETLWVLVGDHTYRPWAPDVTHFMGGLVRIKPNRGANQGGYTPASGNMIDFHSPTGQGGEGGVSLPEPAPELYAYGLRSPFRGSRDSRGWFWIGDVGDAAYEEVNLVTEVGQNFGWWRSEGPCTRACDLVTDPLVYYPRGSHSYAIDDPDTVPATERSVWVGERYERPAQDRYSGKMDGVVPFGDIFTGWVRGLEVDDAGELIADEHIGHLAGVVSWHVGPDGYAYALTLQGDLQRAVFQSSE